MRYKRSKEAIDMSWEGLEMYRDYGGLHVINHSTGGDYHAVDWDHDGEFSLAGTSSNKVAELLFGRSGLFFSQKPFRSYDF